MVVMQPVQALLLVVLTLVLTIIREVGAGGVLQG